MSDSKQIVLRLPRQLVKRIDRVKIEYDAYRSQAVARLVIIGLEAEEKRLGIS